MLPPPRHEPSSEVRWTRYPSGQLCSGQSRQMTARGGWKKKWGERGRRPGFLSRWRCERERERKRERRAQLTLQLERRAFPAGQWRGTIMTGFRMKRCAASTKRRWGSSGGGIDNWILRKVSRHYQALPGRPTAAPLGKEKCASKGKIQDFLPFE